MAKTKDQLRVPKVQFQFGPWRVDWVGVLSALQIA
jgi:hypothetical protein